MYVRIVILCCAFFIYFFCIMSTCLPVCLPLSPFSSFFLSFPSLSLSFPSLPLPPPLSLSPPLSLHYIGVCVCVRCVTFSPPTHSCYGCGLLMSPLSLSLWYVMFCVCYSISLVILSKMTPSLRSSSVII